MIDGSENENGWLKFKLRSSHVIVRRSKAMIMKVIIMSAHRNFHYDS